MSEETKICPFCAETIKAEAIVCKHCGRDLPGASAPPPPTLATASNSQMSGKGKAWLIILGLLAFMCIGFFMIGSGGKPTTPAEAVVLACQDCADAGIEINLWDSPQRVKIVGRVPHLTQAVIIDTAQYDGQKLYRVRANDINGWITEDFVKKAK